MLPADRLHGILPATGDEQYRTEAKSRSFSALTGVAVIRARHGIVQCSSAWSAITLCSDVSFRLPSVYHNNN